MATNGVNGANGAPKTAADFKPEEFQNAKQEKIRNTIFELDEAIANDVEAMEADGEITSTVDKATGKSEVDRIYDWVSVIDNMIGNMSDKVKASLQDSVQILKDWVADLIDMAGMGQYRGENITYEDGGEVVINAKQAPKAGMAATSLEPSTTDNDTAQSLGNSYDTQTDIEDWIKDHYGAVPDVHKYDGIEGDFDVEQKIKQNNQNKLSGTHLTKKQIAEMEAVRRKERMEEDKKFHKSQGLDI